MDAHYGSAALKVMPWSGNHWTEFMHYQYLPVMLPRSEGYGRNPAVLPQRLLFLHGIVGVCISNARATFPHLDDPYVYVTAKRGFASPGNPLNRPGWHCDDFGGTDINFIWCDAFPTRQLRSSTPLSISSDDVVSMQEMETLAFERWPVRRIEPLEAGWLYRLDPFVIHAPPEITAPGGMRSFLKVSVSTHRYNLVGNSHNHDLSYDWDMVDRDALRNQPAVRANKDYA